MGTEVVWLEHDNAINVVLKADDVAMDLSGVTRMTFTVGSVFVESNNDDNDPIRWNKLDYVTGEVRLFLGGEDIPVGKEWGYLVVYDPGNPEGIVWGRMRLSIREDVEGE